MRWSKNHVYWCDLGFLPGRIGFCPSEKAWDREMAKIKSQDMRYPAESHGNCSWWHSETDVLVLITVGPHVDKGINPAAIVGIIAHECMHAWRQLREFIGEAEPSPEFEAYVMQALVQEVLSAYNATRKKLWR